MTKTNAMVIGAGGGIGAALLSQLVASQQYQDIFAVSRTLPDEPLISVTYVQIDSQNEAEVATFCTQLLNYNIQTSHIFCCIGALHGEQGGVQLKPEKRIEELSSRQLQTFFAINTIVPAMWIKHCQKLLAGDKPAFMVFLSARVGSISDNQLGGWYGYRASKAALNMMIKTAQVELLRRSPNVSLLCYHPGTVDTALSKPFQANVDKEKLFTAEFTANCLLAILPTLKPTEAPYYLDWQGKNIPW
jgi:NAD(P)-dependent dehydrogenase (short-subunit alcohol dehydrogenase family)